MLESKCALRSLAIEDSRTAEFYKLILNGATVTKFANAAKSCRSKIIYVLQRAKTIRRNLRLPRECSQYIVQLRKFNTHTMKLGQLRFEQMEIVERECAMFSLLRSRPL